MKDIVDVRYKVLYGNVKNGYGSIIIISPFKNERVMYDCMYEYVRDCVFN